MIKVLIVDDSQVVQEFLTYILSSDPEIQIVGVASSGYEAIELTNKKRPDVITMDYHMPDMNGAEATRAIMETTPTPIVIVSSSLNTKELTGSFSLFEAGALAVVLRPPGIHHPNFMHERNELIHTLKLMSEIKVVKVFPGWRKADFKSPENSMPVFNLPTSTTVKNIQLIAIGASTGGPLALLKILSRLPTELPVPVLIVQHIATGFMQGFVEWLSSSSNIPLRIATDGEVAKPGTGYIAPENFHMEVRQNLVINLSKLPPENGLRPSVNHLFRSVAQNRGLQAIGVLLSGMGTDGAMGLKIMKENGATTIAQDESSSVVFGMPGEAIRIGAAGYILPVEKIAGLISELLNKNNISK